MDFRWLMENAKLTFNHLLTKRNRSQKLTLNMFNRAPLKITIDLNAITFQIHACLTLKRSHFVSNEPFV